MKGSHESVLNFDLEKNYQYYVEKQIQSLGAGLKELELRLGKLAGDLLMLPLRHLLRHVDILSAGPPRPPWAGQGNRQSVKDKRAEVFFHILTWILILVHGGRLLAVVLENVVGILQRFKCREPVVLMFWRVLEKYVPQFNWWVSKLELECYKRPHICVPVFLVALRRTVCMEVPAPLVPFGKCDLRDCLAVAPCTPRSLLTNKMQTNLKMYEQKVKTMFDASKVVLGNIAAFHVDRAFVQTYKPHITVNNSATLMCHNKYLWFADVAGIVKGLPHKDREILRVLFTF